jgi:D-ribose pyranose/furanose isomerase RbsD
VISEEVPAPAQAAAIDSAVLSGVKGFSAILQVITTGIEFEKYGKG